MILAVDPLANIEQSSVIPSIPTFDIKITCESGAFTVFRVCGEIVGYGYGYGYGSGMGIIGDLSVWTNS